MPEPNLDLAVTALLVAGEARGQSKSTRSVLDGYGKAVEAVMLELQRAVDGSQLKPKAKAEMLELLRLAGAKLQQHHTAWEQRQVELGKRARTLESAASTAVADLRPWLKGGLARRLSRAWRELVG
jgi:hypothetical protein